VRSGVRPNGVQVPGRIGQRAEVAAVGQQPTLDRVDVRVLKPWEERLAVQLHDLGRGTDELAHLRTADRHDPTVAHGQGVRRGGCFRHLFNGRATDDQVGEAAHGALSAT
jgi:hypothetical protein